MYGGDEAVVREPQRDENGAGGVGQPTAPIGVREWILAARAGKLDAEAEYRRIDERIDAAEEINCFLWRPPGGLMGEARPQPDGTPLCGLPVGVKDNVDTAGIPTTSGSAVDLGRIPEHDAPAWRRLRERGAVLAGKTHMSEFAYRSHHPEFGRVANPRRLDRATGGSSSGSAAAVAAGLVPAAVGSDTGGSIRIPSSYCGIVGFKGTFGRIENEGLVPLSTTMDHIGSLARSVDDAAILQQALHLDEVCFVDPETMQVPAIETEGLVLGRLRGYLDSGMQVGVRRCVDRGSKALALAGARVIDVDLEEAAAWRRAHKLIILCEAWAYHADRLRAGEPYGAVFRAAIEKGADVPAYRYEAALKMRERAREELARVFERVDALLLPTVPTVAPPGDAGQRNVNYTRFTTLAAFTGLPAISIPAGVGHLDLPVGLQIIGPDGADARVFQIARLAEGALADADERR